jgi:hypothetical protein
VTTTHSTIGNGTGGTLARTTIITLKALTGTISTITDTFVGALHVIVGGVGKDVIGRVDHTRELLVSTLRIHRVRVCCIDQKRRSHTRTTRNSICGQSLRGIEFARGRVKISLGGINMCETELTDAFRTIVGHPVSVTFTGIKCTAFAMTAAGIRTFGRYHS